MIVTELVVPSGLCTSLGEKGGRGILKGRYLSSDNLFVAVQGHVRKTDGTNDLETELVATSASLRVLSHRAFSLCGTDSRPLPYFVVKCGFFDALSSRKITSVADIAHWTHDGQPVDIQDESKDGSDSAFAICCLEPWNDMFIPTLVNRFGSSDAAHFVRGRVEFVPKTPSFPSQFEGLKPLEVLRSKRVALVGLGSMGSVLAVALAAAGVGKLHLLDHDRLTVDNVYRHACDLHHVGRLKVNAVQDLIQNYNLPAEVVAHPVNVVREADVLWPLIEEVDIVLCATDTVPSRRLLNYICVQTRTPLILGCAFDNARIGEIIRVLPGQSACYECTRSYLRAIGALVANDDAEGGAREVPYRSQEVESRQNSIDTGTRVDVSMIAHLQARAAIITLLQNIEGLPCREADLPCNYLTWGVTPGTAFPNPFSFELPFSAN